MTSGGCVVGQAVGHVVEREELLGDRLPHRARAPRGADRQHAVAVDAADRGAVDLQLAGPADRGALGEAAHDPVGPGRRSSSLNTLSSDIIASRCSKGGKASSSGDPTCCVGESGVCSSGNARLDGLQLAEAGVELGVGHRQVGQHVVAVAGVADDAAQLVVLRRGRRRGRGQPAWRRSYRAGVTARSRARRRR